MRKSLVINQKKQASSTPNPILIPHCNFRSFSDLHLHITARMWQQAYMLAYVATGVGFCRALLLLPRPALTLGGLVQPAHWLPAVVAALAVSHCSQHWNSMDQSDNFIFEDYARDLVSGLPENALLLVNDDVNCAIAHYLLRCEGVRPDVQFVRLPLITYEWWKPMQLHHYCKSEAMCPELPSRNYSTAILGSLWDKKDKVMDRLDEALGFNDPTGVIETAKAKRLRKQGDREGVRGYVFTPFDCLLSHYYFGFCVTIR
jgi:hypothetical protein